MFWYILKLFSKCLREKDENTFIMIQSIKIWITWETKLILNIDPRVNQTNHDTWIFPHLNFCIIIYHWKKIIQKGENFRYPKMTLVQNLNNVNIKKNIKKSNLTKMPMIEIKSSMIWHNHRYPIKVANDSITIKTIKERERELWRSSLP